MEAYPGELLVGVFPLVFCVDATISKAKEDTTDPAPPSSNRSQFDRFLDAMAASLLEEPDTHPLQYGEETGSSGRRKSKDDVDDSDAEDEMIFGGVGPGGTLSSPNTSFDGSYFDDSEARKNHPRGSRGMSKIGFPRMSLTPGGGSRHTGNNPRSSAANAASHSLSGTINTSYAKALQHGQNFFQRARIISISARHGFPPSKDPPGSKSRINEYFHLRTLQISKLLAATKRRPIDGILPSGWLEKHSAALPSVILVVIQLSQDTLEQAEQNELLLETLKNLQYSLASKRQCTIQVVGLVQDGVSQILAEQWSQTVADKLHGHPLTVLPVSDLQQDAPPSAVLNRLHSSVRQASLQYYSKQGRRTKQKLISLGAARRTPLLLPLSIRYCFKVAMFYEFQWKQEKSLKYLVEAYRYVETYYRYLLQQRSLQYDDDDDDNMDKDGTDNKDSAMSDGKQGADTFKVSVGSSAANPSGGDGSEMGEGVELALTSNNTEEDLMLLKPPKPPEDMVHQCRAVADWLNFKILQFGLVSHTEGGLLAASSQWQKHAQAFCSPRRSFVCGTENAWLDWSYVAHQRMVISQLVERNPPRALGELGNMFDEVLLRCSPWRNYEATAEALLKCGAEVRRRRAGIEGGINKSTDGDGTPAVDEMRTRYVGGLDNEGLTPKLEDEVKINHLERALECSMRAISLFEREVETAQQKDSDFLPWNRSGARMYYLTGSTLIGLERHAEATPYLEKAASFSKGWTGLELAIRRMLIECYEKHMPEEQDESGQTLASMLLDSYFNAEMSNSDLRKALEKFASLISGGTIKWYRDCIDEADASLPFSFALTFPSATHATAGDGVKASVLIKSNLDYAVHVNSVTLLSLAGQILVPSNDLLSAKNANEGTGGGIIIQANSEILISTHIKLPKDLNAIAVDESGNGGEAAGIAGKGSFAKSARPRTGGITAAAGARMVLEGQFGSSESRVGNSQWSLKCLGGKPLRCDGLRLVFYPVYTAAVGQGENTEIELTIEKKQPKTEAKIKRTPFEEENYIASAWMRPRHLPMNRGPRCLRVLPPMADMLVKNVTENFTNGKVLEGTVNRILIQLTAGSAELCSDIKVRANCSSLLINPEGKTRRIAEEASEEEEKQEIAYIKNPHVRSPVLVKRDESAPAAMTEYGYEIPAGWALLGNGTGADTYSPVVSTLKSGETTYAYFDVFRPSPPITRMDGAFESAEDQDSFAYERDMCQTSIDVSVCYRQERPNKKVKQKPVRRRARKKPGEDAASTQQDPDEGDIVYSGISVSVLWSAPISAVFTPGLKETQPSGNRHPSNTVLDSFGKDGPGAPPTQTELVLIDGERVVTKCSLEAAASADGLMADVEKIRFEDNEGDQVPCRFKLLSGKDDGKTLYKANPNDTCRKLILGSKFSLAWMVEVLMASDYLKGSVSSSLGVISVDWWPSTLELPPDVKSSSFSDPIAGHGPLKLDEPSMCRFMGPPCYIENAPFETKLERLPQSISVAEPFEVTYTVKNKTSLDQTLKISLDDSDPTFSDGFLISGLVKGDVCLGPHETHSLTYTALATKVGSIRIPPVCVSCTRFNTWVIQESAESRRTIFVLP